MATPKKYIVVNPRGIPVGIRILRFEEQEWYEGDEFVEPPGFPSGAVDGWVADGFLREA